MLKNILLVFVVLVGLFTSQSLYADKDGGINVQPTQYAPVNIAALQQFPIYNRESAERWVVDSVVRYEGSIWSSGIAHYPGEKLHFNKPYVKGPGGANLKDMKNFVLAHRFVFGLKRPESDRLFRNVGFVSPDNEWLFHSHLEFQMFVTKAGWITPPSYDNVILKIQVNYASINLPNVNHILVRTRNAKGEIEERYIYRNQNGRFDIPFDTFNDPIVDIACDTWTENGLVSYVFGNNGVRTSPEYFDIPVASGVEMPGFAYVDDSGVPSGSLAVTIEAKESENRWPNTQLVISRPNSVLIRAKVNASFGTEWAHTIWIVRNGGTNAEEDMLQPTFKGGYVSWFIPEPGTYWLRFKSSTFGDNAGLPVPSTPTTPVVVGSSGGK